MSTFLSTRNRLGAVGMLVVAAAMLTGLVWSSKPVDAGLSWCAADPLLYVDGHLLDVNAQVPADQLNNIKGDVVFVFHVPKGSNSQVLFQYSATFPIRSEIVFDQKAWDGKSKLTVPVDVIVMPKAGTFPIRATALDDNLNYVVYEGTAGKPLRFRAVLRDSALSSLLSR